MSSAKFFTQSAQPSNVRDRILQLSQSVKTSEMNGVKFLQRNSADNKLLVLVVIFFIIFSENWQ